MDNITQIHIGRFPTGIIGLMAALARPPNCAKVVNVWIEQAGKQNQILTGGNENGDQSTGPWLP